MLRIRPRRLRKSPAIRDMVRETALSVKDLIYPIFVRYGRGIKEPIPSMPGQFRYSVDMLSSEIKEVWSLGIPAVILFGIPEKKDFIGSSAWEEDGVVQQAVKEIKNCIPDIVVITDVCLCEYTEHGHCGIPKDGKIDNDTTLEYLCKQAVSHAKAGADIVAPSDMMDGRVAAIRDALDQEGYQDVAILSYAVKYASGFYGPFRDAAESAPKFGDRSTYQMDPANAREAIREVELDIEEGADMVMVKPALPYLDIIYMVRQICELPLAAYNVSGEYTMLKAADENGWLDGKRCMMEMLLSIKRAGADLIITYFAKDVAKILNE